MTMRVGGSVGGFKAVPPASGKSRTGGSTRTLSQGKSDNAPSDWKNMTLSQLWEEFSPKGLAKLPVEALSQFPNEQLQVVIDADPNVLADIPADRLATFSSDALDLFIRNLEQRGDYASNEKIRQQARNLRGVVADVRDLPPAKAVPAPGTPPGTPPAQWKDITPPPASDSEASAPAPRRALSFSGAGAELPRLDASGMQRRVGSLSPQSGALDFFRGYTGTQARTQPKTQEEPRYRLLDVQTGDETGGETGGPPPPPPGAPSAPEQVPPGWMLNPNYIPDLDPDVLSPDKNPKYIRDPYYKPPSGPREFAPRPPLENEQAQANLRLIDARIAEIQSALANAQLNADRAERQQNFQEMAFWQQRQDELENQGNQLALSQQRLKLEAELGYAASERADIGTSLEGAGVTGYLNGQPTLERELAIGGAERANLELQASLGNQAAQIRLAEINQAEQQRQFNENLGFQKEQFGFQVAKDPASAFVKTASAANLLTPGGVQAAAPPTRGLAPILGAQPPGQTGVQSAQQAFGENPNVTGNVRNAVVNDGQFGIPSFGRLQALLPSERQQLGAGLNTMGLNPEDVFETSRRLSSVTPPPGATTEVKRRRQLAGVY